MDLNAPTYDLTGKTVFVAGHRGMVGSAICRILTELDCSILTASRSELDLRNQAATFEWMADRKPQAVIVAAARVGGILANSTRPAEFIYDNIAIASNLVEASFRTNVQKLLLLGSSCIYPKFAPQPILEDSLLTGPLEPTNEWYAVAKIAGIKLCQAYRAQYGCDFISAMPTNLYGPHDNFDLLSSHVLPALLAKIHNAKTSGIDELVIWGTGTPRREFLYVDDMAAACVFLMQNYSASGHVNIGYGSDLMITELAEKIAAAVGWTGKFRYDREKPDGTPRKLMDSSLINSFGWHPAVSLEEGIARTYQWFVANVAGRS